VRRGKLKVDESWGFPKLSVEVPDADPLLRRRTQPSGLTVYVLNGDRRHEVAPASLACRTEQDFERLV